MRRMYRFCVGFMAIFLLVNGHLFGQFRPSVGTTFPNQHASRLACDTYITASLKFPFESNRLNWESVSDQSIKLYPKGKPRSALAIDFQYEEGLRYLTIYPLEPFDPLTTYILEFTDQVQDDHGYKFLPYRLEFSTGDCDRPVDLASTIELDPSYEPPPTTHVGVFAAKLVGATTELRWESSSEFMVDHFVIEKSETGAHFRPWRSFTPKGDIHEQANYLVRDSFPAFGATYYRLSYSEYPKEVIVDTVKVFKPKVQFLQRFLGLDQPIELECVLEETWGFAAMISDDRGRQVLRRAGTVPSGRQVVEISLEGLSPGVYRISLFIGPYQLQHKVQIGS
ncbi:Ig-like domain-containing protein [Pontibacter sp. G13]|uniref:Ig-like domain-containing protein n=1 Tax=Pontibacter sp. G13 TaxID=3074898 RepID=UPI00288BD7C9|nr:Ig-like domain-containing protein [Pontibacter sp. G13]WNJ20952.1 Ig-like domain-containing protein [Pontibacter sp. G13]